MEDWIRNLTPDQLPEHHRLLAETIGVEAAIRLMQGFGGTNYYIPKADLLLKQIRDKAIHRAYNGYNIKDLALKYSLSQRQISNILREQGIEVGQLTMFDDPQDNVG